MVFLKKKNNAKLFCFVGPSGSGKTHLAKKVQESGLAKILTSTTTRSKRYGEIDNEDYYFINQETFDSHLLKGEFLEHVEYSTSKYGFLKTEFDYLKETPCIVIVTPDGAEELSKHYNTVFIYINPKDSFNLDELKKRNWSEKEDYAKRLEMDKTVFEPFKKKKGVIIFENKYNKDSEVEIQKLILEIVFNLNANKAVDREIFIR